MAEAEVGARSAAEPAKDKEKKKDDDDEDEVVFKNGKKREKNARDGHTNANKKLVSAVGDIKDVMMKTGEGFLKVMTESVNGAKQREATKVELQREHLQLKRQQHGDHEVVTQLSRQMQDLQQGQQLILQLLQGRNAAQ